MSRASTNLSAWVYPGPSGRLIAQPDPFGNRVLDQSGVGYMGGTPPLPVVPVRTNISPVVGDNVANIQAAINYVSGLPADTNGFRGAVLLSAGEYQLASTINIKASGVVLQGVGSSTNGLGTVLRATASNQYTLVEITGSGSASTVGSTHNITNNFTPAGARSFLVDSPGSFAVGDSVYVRRVATSNWIHDLGMDLLGPPPDVPWTPSGYNIDMERVITHIEGSRIIVDAPITCAIDTHYTNGTLRKFSWSGRITNVGIEHIYAKSDYFGNTTNENHGWTFVQFDKVVNGWARDLVSQYFGYSCVSINSGDKYITVADCQCLDPISIITGGRRYAFVVNDAQYSLVKNCYTRQDRHQFVTQSLTIGPTAFVDGLSDNAHAEAGPHQRWATGILWDKITVHGGNMDIQNAGNYGTGHGWEGGFCAAWNNAANGFIVQNPPNARNWLIGSVGPIQNGTAYVGPHDPGTYDSSGPGATNVYPDSLYFAQLQDRLAVPGLQARDYWLGSINVFTNSPPGGDVVPVDAGWRTAIQSAAGGQPLHAFDIVTNNHWVPFTFTFTLSPTEHVVDATLSLSMRATNSASGDVLYLDSVTNSFSFASLGWLPISTSTITTNITVRVMDLGSQLALLTNGQLDVAVQGDIGIDWAMLEVQVAPNSSATVTALPPIADATVRGGTSAGINFGATNLLTVRLDSSANNLARSYLKWDLSAVSGQIAQARVVLTPVNVPTNGVQQGVAISTTDTWTEAGITWNNQPGGGERFANWIPASSGSVSFDVTPQVLDALNGDKVLSVQLFSLSNVGVGGNIDYASREYIDPNSRPQLLLSILGNPPTISAIADRTVAVNASTGLIPFAVGDADSPASSLLLSGHSSDQTVVPDSGIAFGGSDSNKTVSVTPAANQSGVALITVTVTDSGGLTAGSSFNLTVSSHPASTIAWNGPGAGLNIWSAAGNWSPAEVPETLDDVKFYDAGASGVVISNINNAVDANFGGRISSLQYANTNGNHTTFIAPGQTFSVTGAKGLVVGTETDNGSSQAVFSTITGSGGQFVLSNPSTDLIVRQGSATNGSQRATLDLSGLGTFTATINQVLVGFVGPVNRATGTLYLGKTNNISVNGSPGIGLADNNSNSGGQNLLYLGLVNSIFADSIIIGRQKGTATLKFNPMFANPTALFRGSDGLSRVSSWNIADNSLQSASSSSGLGTNDFSGGTVDAMVDTMIVGKSQKTTGANSTGVLTFTSGTLDINTLQIGFQAQSGATSAGIGRVNMNGTGAVLVVNSVLELGHTSGGAGTSNTFGVLSLSGGAFAQLTSVAAGAGSGPNSIVVNNSTLALANNAGSPATPVSTLALTNASLQVALAAGMTNLVVTALVTGGASNLITISALPNIGLFPAQFTLLAYSTSIGGVGNNFVLAPLLGTSYCGGYLSNNVANNSIDLVVTNCQTPDPFLTWDGTFSGDWDSETANWKNNVAADLLYADGSAVVFNDTAAGTTVVNLSAELSPSSVIISNNVKTYAFQDAGSLSGSMSLTKQGGGVLLLANDGTNDFTGGITISSGTLAIGNGGTGGNLPAGTVTNNASLSFNHSDDISLSNVISGSGNLVKSGTNKLTLSAAHIYSGSTLVSSGTLALVNSGSISASSNIVIAAGAVLDVTGRPDGRLTLTSSQILSGSGLIAGSLVAGANSTVAPGGSIGTLSASGSLTLQGITLMELNAAIFTNDQLTAGSVMTYGGVLNLTNVAGTLAAGSNFKLFSSPNYQGAFTKVIPATTGNGLGWDLSQLSVSGVLRIAALPKPGISGLTISGGNVVIGGTNGTPGGPYYVLTSSNASAPLASWQRMLTNIFDPNGGFAFTNSTANPQQFFAIQVF
jgi:autotransporter-associated beta strand protein